MTAGKINGLLPGILKLQDNSDFYIKSLTVISNYLRKTKLR